MCFWGVINNRLLLGRVPSAHGYLGCQDFSAHWTRPGQHGHEIRQLGNMLLCAAVLAVLLAIGGVEQNLDLVWKLRTLCKCCVAVVSGFRNLEHSATRVDTGFTRAVET
jgi:hypothetical protein